MPCEHGSVRSLLLRSSVRKARQAIEIEHTSPEGPAFAWSNLPVDWEECALKVEPFLEHDQPGHQHLTREGVDDTLVVLGYRE